MSKVNDFLTESGVFYLATADGDQPKVRPLGAHMEMDGKVLFGFGDFKDVYKQLVANPKVEICAFKGGKWLRIAGELVNDDNRDVKVAMLDKMPSLKPMYSADDDNMQMLYFRNATATFSSFTEEPEVIEF